MIAVRLTKRGILGTAVAGALAAAVVGAAPAAASPWWHVTSDSFPATLQPGQAKDETQQLTVSATGGTFQLSTEYPSSASHSFAWNATRQQLQEGLEEMFGKGNVEVPRGQGDASGSEPYEIVFKGQLADRRMPVLRTSASLTGGKSEATASEIARGSSDGQIVVTAANMGDVDLSGSPTPVTIADKLPPGLRALSVEGKGEFISFTQLECSLASVSCTYSGITPPYEELQMIVQVGLEPGAHSGEVNEALAGGGNAVPVKVGRPIAVGSMPVSFGAENYELTPEEEGGTLAEQAGSHPFQLTTTLALNQKGFYSLYPGYTKAESPALVKDLQFKLPPGLIGNPTPFPQCTLAQFLSGQNFINECPDDTAIGVASVMIEVPGIFPVSTVAVPLFNLTPSVGEPARFGFSALGVPVYLDTSLRTGGDYGVTVTVQNITQTATFLGSRVTVWGVPGDPRHDSARGWSCISGGIWQEGGFPQPPKCAPLDQHLPPPLLEMPTSCTGPLQTSLEADSWRAEGSFGVYGPNVALPSLDGCNASPFTPSLSVVPDGEAGSTPTGLTVKVHVPQEVSLDPEGLSESDVKNTTVALPMGVALNPAAADGLQSCTDVAEAGRPEGEIGLGEDAVSSCPEAAKVGTVKIKTPLLPNPIEGFAYLAAQNANPFGSLVALYVVAQDPVSGTLVKLAGEVVPNEVTGQLVSTFKNTPQLPFEDFELHFFGGDRAPLTTPALCGDYTTTSSIEGWSGNPPSRPSSTFRVTSGPNGSPCRSPLRFAPSLTAGTTSIQAGGFSPFTMTMSRGDGSQNLNSIQLKMPPGLLGTLSAVKLCGEPQADLGTCGPESLIGHTIVSVGVGGDPYTVTGGEVFITGPYKGAPYGLSIVNPAKAGPFDLGKVIVRAKIEIDPTTAALTITTDETGPYRIPTIIDGIPLQIQHVNVSIDRPGFTFNPTNCSPLAITGSLTSSEGASSALQVPFQATNCAVLAFKPKLTASTSGKTSRANGASLTVKLGYPAGPYDANIARVKVDLPKRLPSRLTTLQKACAAQVFEANPANCPPASIIGHATATTPILPVALTGPAYFVSHGGEAFPSLIIVLQGYGATVHLVGSTFISKTGITSSTFKAIPDVPVGTFELTLPEGPYSALAANGSLCKAKLTMPTEFVGQNGALIKTTTKIQASGCPKAKQAAHRKKRPKDSRDGKRNTGQSRRGGSAGKRNGNGEGKR